MKMTNKQNPRRESRRLMMSRLAVFFAVLAVAASCTSTTPVRPTSTDKTIKSTSAPADNQPIIEGMTEADPGITDIEVYQGTGEFINMDAAGRPARPGRLDPAV